MSVNLVWRATKWEQFEFSNSELVDALSRSCRTSFTRDDYGFFNGLKAAGIEGAEELLSIIITCGMIDIDFQ